KGLKFELGAQTASLEAGPDGRVAALKLKDGTSVPAALVVMAAGIRPNTEPAEAPQRYCNRGSVGGDHMQPGTDPRIYAIGECVSHRGTSYGLVAPLFEQAKVCANHLAGFGIGRYEGSVTSTKLKVTGVDVFSAGDFTGGEGFDEIVLHDRAGGVYKKIVLKDDKLAGAVMVGDTADGAWYFQLLREGRNVAGMRDHLMFGQSFAQSHLGDTGH